MKNLLFTLATSAISLSVTSAALVSISSVTGFSGGDSYTPGNFSHLTNGAGVSKPDANDPSTWTNDGNNYPEEWYDNTLSGAANGKLAWTAFDFGSPVSGLESLYVFNANYRSNTQLTAGSYNVYYSNGPTNPLPSPPGANSSVDYNFQSGGWTLLTTETVTSSGEIDVVDLSSIGSAQYIGLEIMTQLTPSDNRVGFDEVAFTSSPVVAIPEPSAALLGALGSLLLLRRRK